MTTSGWCWARLLARWVLGLQFFMAGWFKVFHMGATEHASQFFVQGYADAWIPEWLLWAIGTVIPFVELIGGALLCAGLFVTPVCAVLGGLLITVTYGHLLKEPLFSISGHIFPRLVLDLFILVAPARQDMWSLDRLLARNRKPNPDS